MKLEKLPALSEFKGIKIRIVSYLLGMFLISNVNDANEMLDVLKEVIATIENAIYREKHQH